MEIHEKIQQKFKNIPKNKGFAIFRLSPMQAYGVFRRKINTSCYRKSSKQILFFRNPGASPEEFFRLINIEIYFHRNEELYPSLNNRNTRILIKFFLNFFSLNRGSSGHTVKSILYH